LRFGRNLTITGPSVNFTNTGNLRFLSASSYTANITSATSHSTLKTTNNAVLAGTLTINFSGLGSNPAVGETWDLIDYGGNLTGSFSNANFGNDITVNGLPQAVPLGARFTLQKANGGANGKLVQLVQEALVVLRVNRDSGELSLTNPHNGSINIEGYEIRSPLGSLLSTYKGISGAPAGDSGWLKAPLNSETGLAEFKQTGSLPCWASPRSRWARARAKGSTSLPSPMKWQISASTAKTWNSIMLRPRESFAAISNTSARNSRITSCSA
jgi:hypothetical protein